MGLTRIVGRRANGDLGWIQIATFITAGVLVTAGAVGVRRALRGQVAGKWAPRMIGVFGMSLIAAGLLRPDPALGFPPGTPDDPGTITGHGIAHFAAGGLGFLALATGFGVLARHHSRNGRRGWARYSAATAVVFLISFVGIASGSGSTSSAITLSFWLAVTLAFACLSLNAMRLHQSSDDL